MPDRPILDLTYCLNLVIDSTGRRAVFVEDFDSDPGTLLVELGVIPDSLDSLKAQIQFRLGQDGFTIKQSDIAADPTSTVRACTLSVRDYAH